MHNTGGLEVFEKCNVDGKRTLLQVIQKKTYLFVLYFRKKSKHLGAMDCIVELNCSVEARHPGEKCMLAAQ